MRLQIPSPCHEDWRAMTPAAEGRHCKACAKTVVDFTAMTDAEVVRHLRHATERTCGRFRGNQLDREIREPLLVPGVLAQAAPQVVRAALVVGGLGVAVDGARAQTVEPVIVEEQVVEAPMTGEVLLVDPDSTTQPETCTEDAAAGRTIARHIPPAPPPPPAGLTATKGALILRDTTDLPGARPSGPLPPAREGFRWATGTVVDAEGGEPLIGAAVSVKGTKTGTVTDLDGWFELEVPKERDSLTVSYIGYAETRIAVATNSSVLLQAQEDFSGELIYMGYGVAHEKAGLVARGKTVLRRAGYRFADAWQSFSEALTRTGDDFEDLNGLYQPVLPKAVVADGAIATLYPNPSSAAVTLELPAEIDMTLINVFNALGELVLAVPVGGQRKVELSLPGGAAAGTYVVQGTDADGRILVALPWVVLRD